MAGNKIKKILIVENERPMAYALELKLKNSGFDVKSAYGGQEAIDRLKTDKFDLILLDLMMPGKDGFNVLQEMKDGGIVTPAVVLSNLGQQEDLEKAKKLGAKDYFVKSNISINEIIKKIQKF